jgi:imidazolonepropionase
MPTLLPSTAFFLRLKQPPAREMIQAGLPVALASDYNPGSSPSGKMAFILSLACINLRMLPEEAINAATLNGAYAMGVNSELGSIAVGKKANLIVTSEISSPAFIPYAFGSQLIDKVMLNGKWM